MVKHLSRLAGIAEEESKFAGLGITDAIRRVLQDSKEQMSPMDIHRSLIENGFIMAKYSSPMSSIYKILFSFG